MNDALLGDATAGGDRTRLDIAHLTVSGDSPLANAIRRRHWEIAHPEETVVTHDSMI
jgi:hypothetical protein